MRAAIKFIMISAGLVLIAVAVAVILLAAPFEKLVRAQAEKRLGTIYGCKASIARIQLAPREVGIEIVDLVLSNPATFREGEALRCPRLLLLPDAATVFAGTPRLREIRAEGLEVRLRHEIGEGTNLGALAKSAAEHAPENQAEVNTAAEKNAGTGQTAPATERRRPGARRVVVDRFKCTGAKLSLSSSLVPASSVSLNVTPFEVDLADQAVSTAKVASILLRSLIVEMISLKGVLRPVAERLQEELTGATKLP